MFIVPQVGSIKFSIELLWFDLYIFIYCCNINNDNQIHIVIYGLYLQFECTLEFRRSMSLLTAFFASLFVID